MPCLVNLGVQRIQIAGPSSANGLIVRDAASAMRLQLPLHQALLPPILLKHLPPLLPLIPPKLLRFNQPNQIYCHALWPEQSLLLWI